MERVHRDVGPFDGPLQERPEVFQGVGVEDRKSTRLNSSHLVISYAVFCLKKKNTTTVSDPGSRFTDAVRIFAYYVLTIGLEYISRIVGDEVEFDSVSCVATPLEQRTSRT